MLQTTLKRIISAIPSLIGVVIVTFLLTRVLPGDTASYFAGPAATPAAIAKSARSSGSISLCRCSFGITSPISCTAISARR